MFETFLFWYFLSTVHLKKNHNEILIHVVHKFHFCFLWTSVITLSKPLNPIFNEICCLWRRPIHDCSVNIVVIPKLLTTKKLLLVVKITEYKVDDPAVPTWQTYWDLVFLQKHVDLQFYGAVSRWKTLVHTTCFIWCVLVFLWPAVCIEFIVGS